MLSRDVFMIHLGLLLLAVTIQKLPLQAWALSSGNLQKIQLW